MTGAYRTPNGSDDFELLILPDAEAVAVEAANRIEAALSASVAARGRFALAVSGGSTPWSMFAELGRRPLPWGAVDLFQVDERVAPLGSEERNLTQLESILNASPELASVRTHPMPVDAHDLDMSCRAYSQLLWDLLGYPPEFDLVHLGLGADGHTASLFPDDPALRVDELDVSLTRIHAGWRRMTLTLGAINASRQILWVVTGESKAEALAALVEGTQPLPANRIRRGAACILADRAAARLVLAEAGENA